MTRTTFTPDPKALYLTDNGRCLCGSHLGETARATSRDISGQRIQKISAADIAFEAAGEYPFACEDRRCAS